jgi:hypothetical protein
LDEDTKQVRLCDLRMNSCRWPLGGGWEHVEFYCAEPTTPADSWCAEHRKRVFARTMIRRSGVRTPMVLKNLRKNGAGG